MADTPRLTCREAMERLDDFLDRELTPAELAQVEAHFSACTGCGSHRRFEQGVLEGVRAKLGRIHAPPGLLERIASRLRAE